MKLSDLYEGITPADKDPAEDTIGYWIVLEKNDKVAWGPFDTLSRANDALKNHKGYATHGVPVEKIVYIEHGWADEDDNFHMMDKD